MRAITYRSYGGPEVLELTDLPKPVPAPGEVLIAVKAAGVNPADGKWRIGMFKDVVPVTLPQVPGYDVAGVVESAGVESAGVEAGGIEAGGGFAPGTRVVAVLDALRKGGYAEYACIGTGHVAAIPDSMSFETAAAIPTPGLTGLQVVETFLDVQPGQRLLVTGAVGAVGSVAVYAARARGATVIAAVRADQAETARRAGAGEVAIIGEPWSGEAFDHVVDTLGGAEVAALAGHLRPGGRLATVATTPIPPEGLPAEPEFYGVMPDGAGLARLVAAVAAGDLPITIGRVYPLAEAGRAQAAVDAGGTGGKVIIAP
ncbi:MAG TPA: NADP-dependent oxidoreductase [Novosphingobium sp.]